MGFQGQAEMDRAVSLCAFTPFSVPDLQLGGCLSATLFIFHGPIDFPPRIRFFKHFSLVMQFSAFA